MDTRLWGPSAWDFLHTISFDYPEVPSPDDKKNMLIFLNSLSKVLPCSWCRKHFNETLKKNPPELQSRESFSRWFVDVHNSVNKRLKKPEYSYNDARKKYESHRGQCSKNASAALKDKKCPKACSPKNLCITVAIFILLILLIILLIIYIVCRHNSLKT